MKNRLIEVLDKYSDLFIDSGAKIDFPKIE